MPDCLLPRTSLSRQLFWILFSKRGDAAAFSYSLWSSRHQERISQWQTMFYLFIPWLQVRQSELLPLSSRQLGVVCDLDRSEQSLYGASLQQVPWRSFSIDV